DFAHSHLTIHWTSKRFTFWFEAISLPILYGTRASIPAVSPLPNCHLLPGERTSIFKRPVFNTTFAVTLRHVVGLVPEGSMSQKSTFGVNRIQKFPVREKLMTSKVNC
uniref:Uncharacterized protein n=1 Tax=Romanomermis culicivorax TaxID=13658 RepID=A0A915IMQ9_ROMCU